MTSSGVVDFGRTTEDYRQYRAQFPQDFFNRIAKKKLVKNGDTLLDVGSGTGDLARGFARMGCSVTAADASPQMVEEAQRGTQRDSLNIAHVTAKAEEMPFADSSFDVVTAGQCWHWFDRSRAAQEIGRVLKPRGLLLIVHFDWLPLTGNIVSATEALIERHNPHWVFGGRTGVHPAWYRDLSDGGFGDIESFSFDVLVPYSHEGWLGRVRASAGVGASLPAEAVQRFNDEHREMLGRRFPEDTLMIPHRVWCVYGYKQERPK